MNRIYRTVSELRDEMSTCSDCGAKPLQRCTGGLPVCWARTERRVRAELATEKAREMVGGGR